MSFCPNEENYGQEQAAEEEKEVGFKIHISRVPTKFTEEIVQRILSDKFGSDSVSKVELILPREDVEGEDNAGEQQDDAGEQQDGNHYKKEKEEKTHRGFGFVTFKTEQAQQEALKLEKIKGGRKANSKKSHTIYLRPYAQTEEETNVCYLWKQHRCPYGDDCKFSHVGPGGTIVTTAIDDPARSKKKKGKCFAFKKGKCDKGDDCPFSHDFQVDTSKKIKADGESIPKSEKDCINWKTKGKCRKQDKCPYKHDPEVQKKALQKLAKKKNPQEAQEDQKTKERQPLSVRVFGLNYETTAQDIRDFFKDCGPIGDVTFPIFEDSGRSKGYCGVWFSSPKAVAKAIELDGQELMGRWLRIQAGKMYLKQWEGLHSSQPPAKRPRTISSE